VRLWAPPVLLALLTLAAFANAVPNGFVWIDHWQVESGGLIAHSWTQLWNAMREPLGTLPGWEGAAPYARPLVVVVLSVVHGLVGPNASAFHLTLVVLHVANVVLAFRLLSRLGLDTGSAFVAAGIFALHPLQTAAVSWISGIADPLYAFFLLSALILQLAASAG